MFFETDLVDCACLLVSARDAFEFFETIREDMFSDATPEEECEGGDESQISEY